MLNKITVEDTWAENIFEWLYQSVGNSGGDGAGIICCENCEETADEFYKWANSNGRKLYHPKDSYKTPNGNLIINFHDRNENYMFSNEIILVGYDDICFIIKGDCKSYDHDFTIKQIDK